MPKDSLVKSCVDCKPADMPCQVSKECKQQRRDEKHKEKVSGYYDYKENLYIFAGAGKGGKVFMSLYFFRGKSNLRHRMNIPNLPIRFTIEEAQADLAVHAQSRPWQHVSDIYEHNKRSLEEIEVNHV